jgi:arylsulfatase A-like enzyme
MSPAAWTVPSHASLFTGTYPSRHGVTRSRLTLGPELTPLPEALRRSGYRTYAVSNNYWLSRETRFDRGFDRFVQGEQLFQVAGRNRALERQDKRHAVGIQRDEPTALWPRVRNACCHTANRGFDAMKRTLRRSFHLWDKGAARANRVVGGWVREWQRLDGPFFAFVHYMEPHLRYGAPRRYRRAHLPPTISDATIDRLNQDPWRYLTGRSQMTDEDFELLAGLYDGEISYVDACVGRLHQSLKDAGLLENTLLIITSDHGDNLGEHQLMDHAYCLYDTLLRVPLILAGPGDFARRDRIGQTVQTLDLFRTLLELGGVRDTSLLAQAQTPALFPTVARGQTSRPAVAEYLEPQPPVDVLRARYPGWDGSPYDRTLRAVRMGRHKYILGSDGREELYDVEGDPGESRNVVAEEPAKAAEMRRFIEQWVGSCEPAAGGESVELDAVVKKRLEELGYLA